jgi:hypothetical protein
MFCKIPEQPIKYELVLYLRSLPCPRIGVLQSLILPNQSLSLLNDASTYWKKPLKAAWAYIVSPFNLALGRLIICFSFLEEFVIENLSTNGC